MSLSIGNLSISRAFHRKTAENMSSILKIHNVIMIIFVITSLAVIVISSVFANIQGKKEEYSDFSNDWEACLTQADYQKLAITPLAQRQQTNLVNCMISTDPTSCTTCLTNYLNSSCVSPSSLTDVSLPTGHLIQSLSLIGIQVVIFCSIAHFSFRRALAHPTWLAPTIPLMLWFVVASLTYYTVTPILPVPSQTNSTVIILLYYLSNVGKFDQFNNYNNSCGEAQSWMAAYIAFILVGISTVFVSFILCCYAQSIRYKSSANKAFAPFKFVSIPLTLSILAIIFYILVIAAKMLASTNELDAIDSNLYPNMNDGALNGQVLWYEKIWFPFVQPNLDLATIVAVCSFMSVFRGYFAGSLSAFRLAFGAALVFTFSTYPVIIGAFQFYDYQNFSDDDTCKGFFLKQGQSSAFGYPTDDQAMTFCSSFRLALIAVTGLSATMHCLTISCLFMVMQNQDRKSFSENVTRRSETEEDAIRALNDAVQDSNVSNPLGKSLL